MDWTTSPSGGVERKRVYLSGEAESGQVSSLVRYLPGATFQQHEHPKGEEIFVLEGTFSDHTVDCQAPGYLLNPEGFKHAPWSTNGCLIFVRLQQYRGTRRVVLNSNEIDSTDGVTVLHEEGRRRTLLATFVEGRKMRQVYPGGVEGFVLKGQLRAESFQLKALDWFRFPPGASVTFDSGGCQVYLQENVVEQLWMS